MPDHYGQTYGQLRTRLEWMNFDIRISDLNLPDGDGLELVPRSKEAANLKAIAITGRESGEEHTL